ncbi:Drug/metabolite transporter [Penicillium expansum]|uniref:Drug/metabolite transporter n=1 Tax=Penicillium expansum TaxID=27334 RepID=A0A0A2J6X9_PENEN|nr:Drug/metabolite transporter [Penicillium expansum]KGO40774.1 Drug/metabolite transporter [Penicillium expansum]KGO51142.1 Drug/metabolite transporter [Penicillium expansum]KGO64489.1 Drug/metabolite transporter [Penicillium expansum]
MVTPNLDSASEAGQYQDHPDAPLPIPVEQRSSSTQTKTQAENEHDYNCESESEADSQPALAQSEPRPIEDDEDDEAVIAAAARPRRAWQVWWLRNKGMGLVLLAQAFAASMNVMTQVLEIHSAMHPFQILFARMSITAVASYLYMYIASTPSPLGTRPVRGLLLLRALFGFMGVYGLYYSVQYLPLSEATVITFLSPIISCYACSLLIPGETFSRKQLFAGLVSLGGVVLIARPFSKRDPSISIATPTAAAAWALGISASTDEKPPSETDSYHHVMATIVALFGVVGASGAYTSIRMIGRRAHPLVSVTYFSSVTTVISFVAMASLPSVPFRIPTTAVEWTLLTGLGVCGFLLQFLLTAGLSYVPPASVSDGKPVAQGGRATSMLYMQMLFAVFYDKVVWGSTLSPISWVGSAIILVCAVFVAFSQEKPVQRGGSGSGVEEYRDVEGYKDAADEERAEGSVQGN